MLWKTPPRIKVYEALGCIADERITYDEDTARVRSSSGNKTYYVAFNEEKQAIMCNDNGSYWQGYFGYPAIAFLMIRGIIPYTSAFADNLAGIAWKDIIFLSLLLR